MHRIAEQCWKFTKTIRFWKNRSQKYVLEGKKTFYTHCYDKLLWDCEWKAILCISDMGMMACDCREPLEKPEGGSEQGREGEWIGNPSSTPWVAFFGEHNLQISKEIIPLLSLIIRISDFLSSCLGTRHKKYSQYPFFFFCQLLHFRYWGT